MLFPPYDPFKETLDLILIGGMVLFTTISSISACLVRFFIMPELDKKFYKIQIYDYYWQPFNRCSLYANYISPFGIKRKKSPIYKIMSDLSLNYPITKFQLIISNIKVISTHFLVLCVLTFGLHYLIFCIKNWLI